MLLYQRTTENIQGCLHTTLAKGDAQGRQG